MEDDYMKKNIKVFRDSQIILEKGFIRCPEAACRISALSQVALEKYSDTWVFPGYSGEEGLILELNSGSQYVFFSGHKEILKQAYDYLCDYMADRTQEGKWLIDFKEGVINEVLPEDLKPSEEVPDTPAVPEAITQAVVVPNSPVELELDKMIEFLSERGENESDVMELLIKIKAAGKSGNQVELLELYCEFIGHSLIDICNELGLNLLIGEITTRVFASPNQNIYGIIL